MLINIRYYIESDNLYIHTCTYTDEQDKITIDNLILKSVKNIGVIFQTMCPRFMTVLHINYSYILDAWTHISMHVHNNNTINSCLEPKFQIRSMHFLVLILLDLQTL